MNIYSLLKIAQEERASDLFISPGAMPTLKIGEKFKKVEKGIMTTKLSSEFFECISNKNDFKTLYSVGEVDFSLELRCDYRFRVNAFMQREGIALAIRMIPLKIPTLEELSLPQGIKTLAERESGLILVTGSTGSGKSTTLASIIDFINKEKSKHIITIENPIEYIHKHNNSIINQREIGTNTSSFNSALQASLRQNPDIILLGEIRDLDSVNTALRAAETGHLVLSTLHTNGAAKSIDRIIDMYKPDYHYQIRSQLSNVLEGVISQKLLPKFNTSDDSYDVVPAVEVMIVQKAIRNLIKDGKTNQINNMIQLGSEYGMLTMDQSMLNLYRNGEISKRVLLQRCEDKEFINALI